MQRPLCTATSAATTTVKTTTRLAMINRLKNENEKQRKKRERDTIRRERRCQRRKNEQWTPIWRSSPQPLFPCRRDDYTNGGCVCAHSKWDNVPCANKNNILRFHFGRRHWVAIQCSHEMAGVDSRIIIWFYTLFLPFGCVFAFCFLFSPNCFALCTLASNEIDDNLGHDTHQNQSRPSPSPVGAAHALWRIKILWKVDGNVVRVVDKTKWKNNNARKQRAKYPLCVTQSSVSAINCEQQQKRETTNDERDSSATQSQSSN